MPEVVEEKGWGGGGVERESGVTKKGTRGERGRGKM